MKPAAGQELSPAGANGHANGKASPRADNVKSFGAAQPHLLQELHDDTHFSLPELGALRERFAAHGAPHRTHAERLAP